MNPIIKALRELGAEWLKESKEPAIKEASNEFLAATYVDELNEKLDQLAEEYPNQRPLRLATTHTVVNLPVPTAIYIWIRQKLLDAGYDHVFGGSGKDEFIDMHGIGLTDDGMQEAYSKLAREIATVPTLYTFQERIKSWLGQVFDAEVRNSVTERALRLCEEALELAQALECDRAQVHKLVDYVFDRDIGNVGQEIAGTMVTLAAVATAAGVDLEEVSLAEVKRIEQPEIIEKIRARQAEKRAALMTGV